MIFKIILTLYNLALAYILLFQGIKSADTKADLALISFLLPVAIYFTLFLVERVQAIRKVPLRGGLSLLKSLMFPLGLATTSFWFLLVLSSATSSNEYLFALMILPLPAYFWVALCAHFIKDLKKPQERPKEKQAKVETKVKEEILSKKDEALATSSPVQAEVDEPTKRDFLKRAGGIGLGLLAYSILNPKQAGAAFFGSVPGPGTVALKDTTDTKIDPAIKAPTDAFGITEVDDGSPSSYYGFVNKTGAWYILKEDESTGDYSFRYVKGTDNFSTNWTNRGSLTYGYFNQTF